MSKPHHYVDIRQISFFHYLLTELLSDLYDYAGPQMMTGLWGTWGSGVHGTIPLRAVDIGSLDHETGVRLQDYLNSRWEYDPKRPGMNVALWHNAGRGWHLHIQSHPNTSRKTLAPA